MTHTEQQALETAWTYFSSIRNGEDCATRFRELAKRWHPDRPNGNKKIMQAINAVHKAVKEAIAKGNYPRTRYMTFSNSKYAKSSNARDQSRSHSAWFDEQVKEAAKRAEEAKQRRAQAEAQTDEAHEKRKASAQAGQSTTKITDEVEAKIQQIVAALKLLDGLVVERANAWLWVSGETKKHKEALGLLKLRWSPNKQKWYYAGVPAGKGKAQSWSHISSKYQAQEV
jgi:curved DNA-binding protein CbpA